MAPRLGTSASDVLAANVVGRGMGAVVVEVAVVVLLVVLGVHGTP